MSKMGFMDDMNWYGNMHKGLDAIMKMSENKGLGAIMAMSKKTASYEKGLGAIIAMSKTPSYEKGLGAIMAMAGTNAYEKNFKGLRSISESLNTYNKVQFSLDKISKATTGLAFAQPPHKNLFYDVMQKQNGLLSAINSVPKQHKTLMDMLANVNNAIPKQHLTLMDAMNKINIGIPNSLHDTAFRIFQKQNELFGFLRKQPWEINTHAFAQAAALSQHAGLVSKSFLSEIILNQEWGELEESERSIDKIGELVNDFFTKRIDLEQFYENVAEFISAIAGISNSEKAKNIREKITYFLGIIGFIISVYALKMSMDAVTTSAPAVASTAEHDLIAFRKDTLVRLEQLIPAAYAQRIALQNNSLRFRPMCKSKNLAKVKEGQIVRVIEIHHKWMFVTFTDEKKEEILSGWVMKKYFDEF
jgi:hypothetical protein